MINVTKQTTREKLPITGINSQPLITGKERWERRNKMWIYQKTGTSLEYLLYKGVNKFVRNHKNTKLNVQIVFFLKKF